MDQSTIQPQAEGDTSAQTHDNHATADVTQNAQTDIDPRIAEVIGEEKVTATFGPESTQDEEEQEEQEEKEENSDGHDDTESSQEEYKEHDEQSDDDMRSDAPQQTETQQRVPTRLDRRIAQVYINNLVLGGTSDVPSLEEVMEELSQYSHQEKINALHFHLQTEKRLRKDGSAYVVTPEDADIIREAQREEIRGELIAEQQAISTAENFVTFIENHKELDENAKEYNPTIARAVEALWNDGNGLSITEAYRTVTEQIAQAMAEVERRERKDKNRALSGAMSGSGAAAESNTEMTWDDVQKIKEEDPERYMRELAAGKYAHLI